MQSNNIKKNSSQTFLKGAMVLSISMAIVSLCGMVYKLMLTRIYSMFGDQYAGIGTGLFTNAYEIYIPLFTLATAGFPIAVSRLISESIAKERYKDVRQIYKVSIPFFVIMGLVCFSLMVGLSFVYVNVIKSPYSIYAMITLAPSIFFGCIVSIYRGYFEGQRNMAPTAISEIVEAAVKMVVGLPLSYIVMKIGMAQYKASGTIFGLNFESESEAMNMLLAFSVASAIFAISFGGLLSFVTLRIIYKRNKNAIPQEYFDNSVDALSRRETFNKLLKTAIPIGLAALVMSISSSIDTMVIQNVLYKMAQTNPKELLAQYDGNLDSHIPLNPTKSKPITIHTYLLGAYSCALTIMQLVTHITQVFGTSAMPSVTDAYTKGDKSELKKAIETVLKLTVLVTFPAGIGMFVLSYPIMELLYDGYIAVVGARVLCVMGLSVIFIATSTPICSMLQGVGRIDMPLKLYSIAMVMKIALNYAFVSIVSINIMGAAVGSLVAYLFVCVVGMYFLIKKAGVIPNFLHTVVKPLVGSIVCGLSAYLVYKLLNPIMSDTLATLLSIVIASVFYLISLLLMHTFTENEIKMLPKGNNVVTILAKLHLLR
ncbi:MAG: polysaccharide biosynthesis protein [Ruminococcus sp.]|nr:polysaccharide biosynthesis protein [Ruminococcus sp.]